MQLIKARNLMIKPKLTYLYTSAFSAELSYFPMLIPGTFSDVLIYFVINQISIIKTYSRIPPVIVREFEGEYRIFQSNPCSKDQVPVLYKYLGCSTSLISMSML